LDSLDISDSAYPIDIGALNNENVAKLKPVYEMKININKITDNQHSPTELGVLGSPLGSYRAWLCW
jgi:hypothetical protein